MDKVLNVLYQSNDGYAPQTGVSMTSLCENNKDIPEINFFILDDRLSDSNKSRMRKVCEIYNRNIKFINTEHILDKLLDLGVNAFKNTYTTYFKLLAVKDIQTKNDLLLQLDGDTIINESLDGLFDIFFGDDGICGATYDCVQNSYKALIGIPETDEYFNCGVLWINQSNWRKHQCEERIVNHLLNVRHQYYTVDQDILNVLFRKNMILLDAKYNVNSGFYLYGISGSYYIYDLSPDYYFDQNSIENSLNNPIINHCMGAMCGRPWEKNNFHPQNNLYDHYLELSPWSDLPKIEVKRTSIFNLQKNLYKLLPRSLYNRMHKIAIKRYLHNRNKECLQ